MSQRLPCPICGHENASHDSICGGCGQPILDRGHIARPSASAPPAASSPPIAPVAAPALPRKVCPLCGTINESYALLCSGAGCGNDLSAVTPSGGTATPASAATLAATPASAPPATPTPALHLTVGAQRFACRDGDIIGREGTVGCQLFAGLGTVSRRHVALAQRDGHWFLTALAGVQNTTQLDGRELARGIPQPLTGEHSLRLSTQCEVRLKVGDEGEGKSSKLKA